MHLTHASMTAVNVTTSGLTRSLTTVTTLVLLDEPSVAVLLDALSPSSSTTRRPKRHPSSISHSNSSAISPALGW